MLFEEKYKLYHTGYDNINAIFMFLEKFTFIEQTGVTNFGVENLSIHSKCTGL